MSQACELVQARAAKQEVTIKITSPADPVVVWVDANQLITVLVNLFLNALDVLKPGGHLEACLCAPLDASINLTILDNGTGIPPEIMAGFFLPLRQTSRTGPASASICPRIMEEHGGSITASNRPEGGACFTLQLPVNSKGGDR